MHHFFQRNLTSTHRRRPRLSATMPIHPRGRRGKRMLDRSIAGFTSKPWLDLARENGSLPLRDNVP
jgi:hypothetical protein